MNEFEKLQQSWKSQALPDTGALQQMQEHVQQSWNKLYRARMIANVCVSTGFAAAIAMMVWVYITYHKEHSIFFTGSLFFMIALLLVYLLVLWRGMVYKKDHAERSSAGYLDHRIKQLQWQRKILTTYSEVYKWLLWAALMMYECDVLWRGGWAWLVGGLGVSTLYVFGATWLTRKKRQRNIDKTDKLIIEMREVKAKLEKDA